MLEWTRTIGEKDDFWKAGRHTIWIDGDGMFQASGAKGDGWPTLAAAKAWCQSQEDAANPEPAIPLPKPGDVWGVPGKPETRRLVHVTLPGEVNFSGVQECGLPWIFISDWHAWVRETGAVELAAEPTTIILPLPNHVREILTSAVKWLDRIDLRRDTLPPLFLRDGDPKPLIKTIRELLNGTVALDLIGDREALRQRTVEAEASEARLDGLASAQADAIDALAAKVKVLESLLSDAKRTSDNADLMRIASERDELRKSLANADARAEERMDWRTHLEAKVKEAESSATHWRAEFDAEAARHAKTRASRDRLLAELQRLRDGFLRPEPLKGVISLIITAEEGVGK